MDFAAAGDEDLIKISRDEGLSLNLEEMRKIQGHFSSIGRIPTELELKMFGQTWSEHCIHKTFQGDIITENGKIQNLLKSTIARVTSELDFDWCFSVFEDNAGIVDFEDDIAIAFKVETHNHPSALEPFGGAATGVGGVIRDILGVWGEPIANTNVLCFGPLNMPHENVPLGSKHPRFIYKYVVSGIGTYGNNMGIPTVNGAIFFDESYVANPLVYCGTIGIVPKSKYVREAKPGDIMLLVGGKTGRDGIQGVTFASAELNEKSEDTSTTAVQIGNPILEETIKRGILQLRDERLGSAITDLGGGGLSSAVGEMAHSANSGVKIALDTVPLKHPSMEQWEIWISESQERMLLAIPEENLKRALEIFEDEGVGATPIGRFTEGNTLKIEFNGEIVAELNLEFLFEGVPKVEREAKWEKKVFPRPDFEMSQDLTEDLLGILSSSNVASKEEVIRTYDHEVKAISIIKPLQGINNDAPGDAAVIKPIYNSWKGVVISNGLNPEYGKIDPYFMAASAIDEAIRNNVAVGGRRISLLDNFCWGNPEKQENMAGLVRAATACYDIAKGFKTPFISGKDSLYNESPSGPVTPTLLISAVGIIPDVRCAVTMDIKKPGSAMYIIGETFDELGGSHYYKIHGFLGNRAPEVHPKTAKSGMDLLTLAMDKGIVSSCHDLSEGGLSVAAAEMALGGDIGIELALEKIPVLGKIREDSILFSESNSRFLVEVQEDYAEDFEKLMKGIVFARAGSTTKEKELKITSKGRSLVSSDIESIKRAWQGGL
ncbi:MAG: phosphoribosylformylglycinamidine synthase subunit PurL [Candidatus Hydrothermarchaeaceae archaeon]